LSDFLLDLHQSLARKSSTYQSWYACGFRPAQAGLNQLFLDIANDVELFLQKRVTWIIANQILRSSGRKYRPHKNRQKVQHST
jgi:hypothetical protein